MYCPNCSERFLRDEGFCPKCGWLFADEKSVPSVIAKVRSGRKERKAMYDFKYYHWDMMHVGQRQFPVGRW